MSASAWTDMIERKRAARAASLLFLVIGGLNALVLVWLTPPFQVHDEFQHFFRSYQLSQGVVWGDVEGGRAGGQLPASLERLVLDTWGTLGIWTVPPLRAQPLASTMKRLGDPLAPAEVRFADFSGAAPYSPPPYAPQAVAIGIGRSLELSPLWLLYLGRVANAVVAVSMMTVAIRLFPFGHWAVTAVALLPMAQFEYASVAPDALIIAAATLYTAVALRAAAALAWTPRRLVVAALSSVVFCSIKIVYAPFLLIGFDAAFERGGLRRRFAAAQALLIVFVVAASLAWLRSSNFLIQSFLAGDKQHQNLAAILTDPFAFAVRICRDLLYHGRFYVQDLIGIFGAATVPMPPVGYWSAGLALAASLIVHAPTRRMAVIRFIWPISIVVSTYLAIVTAIAILDTQLGSWLIPGVQGRYFIPLVPLLLATLLSVLPPLQTNVRRRIIVFLLCPAATVATLTMDWTLIDRFGLVRL